MRLLALTPLFSLFSCATTAADAQDHAFVARAILATQGRAPLGDAEVQALEDIIGNAPTQADGRREVVDKLMRTEAFVDYWSRVLADHLEPDRTGTDYARSECWDYPLLYDEFRQDPVARRQLSDALADHLRNQSPRLVFANNLCQTSASASPLSSIADPAVPAGDGVAPVAVDAVAALDTAVTGDSAGDSGLDSAGADSADSASDSGDPAAAVHGFYDADGLDEAALWSALSAAPSEPFTLSVDAEEDPYGGPGLFDASDDGISALEGLDDPATDFTVDPVPEPLAAVGQAGGGSGGWSPTDCGFNMSDVVQTAVRSDAIDAALRTWLFPSAAQANFMAVSQDVYYGQDLSCVGCHQSTFSTTDGKLRHLQALNDEWDRFEGSPFGREVQGLAFDVEGSLYGSTVNGTWRWGGRNANAYANLDVLYHNNADLVGSAGNRTRPFGLVGACFANSRNATVYGGLDLNGSITTSLTTTALPAAADEDWNAAHLSDALNDGFDSLAPKAALGVAPMSHEAFTPNAGSFLTCAQCHDGTSAPELPVQAGLDRGPGTMHPEIIARTLVNGSVSGRMPAVGAPAGMTPSDVGAALVLASGTQMFRFSDAREALAWRASQAFVDTVVEEVLGQSLLLPHGYPRNPEAADMLASLTWTFVANDYSLRALLREMLLTSNANGALEDKNGALASYPPIFTPWRRAPAQPDTNDLGDALHARGPHQLVQTAFRALGWPRGHIHGYYRASDEDRNAFPDVRWYMRTGGWAKAGAAPMDLLAASTFMDWSRRFGNGQKPAYVAERDVVRPRDPATLSQYRFAGDTRLKFTGTTYNIPTVATARTVGGVTQESWSDLIDAVVEPSLREAGSSTRELSCAEALAVVRGRVLGESVPGTVELQWAATRDARCSGASLYQSWKLSGAGSADLEAVLREYLGVLLRAPDYALVGLPPVSHSPPAGWPTSPEVVCLEEDPACTAVEWTQYYTSL